MKLLDLQFIHTRRVALLVEFLYREGYTATWGYTFRSAEECKRLAALGLGIEDSLHKDKLAVDFNIFKKSIWLKKSEELKFAGDFWKSLSTPGAKCVWGGDFKKSDGNHFSIAYNGKQ